MRENDQYEQKVKSNKTPTESRSQWSYLEKNETILAFLNKK